MKIPKAIRYITGLLVVGLFFGLPLLSPRLYTQETPTEARTVKIDQQTSKVSLLQNQKNDLQDQLNSMERENQILEFEIIELEKEKSDLESKISKNQISLSELEKPLPDTAENTLKQSLEKEKGDLTQKLKIDTDRVEEIKKIIPEKESQIETNKPLIEDLNNQLKDLEENLSKEVNILQSQVVILGISVSRYVLLIILYWFIYRVINFLSKRFTKNQVVRDFIRLISIVFTALLTIFTLLIAFISNLAILVTSFGVISAAMVVALQEFISSFFAWFVIKARGPYKKGDLIQIQTTVQVYTGIVKNIGIFRTVLSEKSGGENLDREQFTGKIVDFPNNLILKHPVKNFTQSNYILWHTLDIIVTYESDIHIAKKVIQESLDRYFRFALDHKDTFLDNVYNLENIYKPKVYMSLSNDGPCFTIWFAVRTGKLREIVERLSTEILDEFKNLDIEIAYKTSRIIHSGEYKNTKELEVDIVAD